jgi:hypothetical protein
MYRTAVWVYLKIKKYFLENLHQLTYSTYSSDVEVGRLAVVVVRYHTEFKGIVQPFELGGETRLIRSAVKK